MAGSAVHSLGNLAMTSVIGNPWGCGGIEKPRLVNKLVNNHRSLGKVEVPGRHIFYFFMKTILLTKLGFRGNISISPLVPSLSTGLVALVRLNKLTHLCRTVVVFNLVCCLQVLKIIIIRRHYSGCELWHKCACTLFRLFSINMCLMFMLNDGEGGREGGRWKLFMQTQD